MQSLICQMECLVQGLIDADVGIMFEDTNMKGEACIGYATIKRDAVLQRTTICGRPATSAI